MRTFYKACYYATLFYLLACGFLSCSTEEPAPVSEPPPNLYVERGKRLVQGFAACSYCHGKENTPGSRLSGGQVLYDTYGAVSVPNITPSTTGIGDWTTSQIIKLMRTSTRPDGETISNDLHAGFEWMSDEDILAVISYLKNVPAVENEVDRRSIGVIDRNTSGFFESVKAVTGYVPEIDKSYQVEYGKYIVDHVARCGSCHNSPVGLMSDERYLAGGALVKNSSGEKTAPNISQNESSGIGSWSEDDIVQFLRTGAGPQGNEVDPAFCPVRFFANGLPEDQISVAKYLKTVPAF